MSLPPITVVEATVLEKYKLSFPAPASIVLKPTTPRNLSVSSFAPPNTVLLVIVVPLANTTKSEPLSMLK